MAFITFTFDLHDDDCYEQLASALEWDFVDDATLRKAADLMPFYEVHLECILNTDTGEITITGVDT